MTDEIAPRSEGNQEKTAQGEIKQGAEGHDRAKKARTKGKDKPQETSEAKKAQQERERKFEAKREQVRKAAKGAKVPYKEAVRAVGVIAAVQDEHDYIINPETVEQLEGFLQKYAKVPPSEKLKVEELVVLSQEVLRAAKKIEVEDGDLEYTEGPNKAVEKASIQADVDKVQSFAEETLSLEKVAHHVQVEEYGELSHSGGPGAAKAEEIVLPSELNVSGDVAKYIREFKRIETIGLLQRRLGALEGIEGSLREAILSGKIDEHESGVSELRNSISQEFETLTSGTEVIASEVDIETKGILDSLTRLISQEQTSGGEWDSLNAGLDRKIGELRVIEEAAEPANFKRAYLISRAIEVNLRTQKNQLEAAPILKEKLENIINRETGLLAQLDKKFRIKYEDLSDEEKTTLVGDIDQQAITLFKQIVGGFGARPDEAKELLLRMTGEDPTGFREWRVMRSIEGLENAVRVRQLTEGPVIWEEIPERVANVYKFIESTDFSVQELQSSIGEAISLVRLVQPDTAEGRRLREKLIKELEAFQSFHSFRITMQRANMNPEKVLGVFETFKDDTWENFAKRFSHDSQGREYYDKNGDKINLFDVAQSLYFDRLHSERLTMNLVEGLTVVGIEKELTRVDFKTIEKLLGRGLIAQEKVELDDLRKKFKDRLGDDAKLWGKDIEKTKKIISKWYQEETLLGSLANLDKRREEMREDLSKKLDGLQVMGKDDKLRKVDFDEFIRTGGLESLDYNAYHFVWSFAWSDYDIIRVYGREAAGKDDPMMQGIVYNESSYMYFGRHIDHPWEFFTDELRGRPGKEREVNEIIRKKFPGKHHELFDRNRIMVRFFDRFVSPEQQERLNIKKRVEDLMRDNDFSHPDRLERGFVEEWAKGIVLGELIDSGEVKFDMKFSDVAEGMTNTQYLMGDLFADRAFTVTYLSKPNFQAYLANPTEGQFLDINNKATKYYSGRNIRLWPWMTLAFRAHWEFVSKNNLRLFHDPNLTSSEAEKFIEGLVSIGSMERKQGDREKRELLGFREIGGQIKIGEYSLFQGKEFKIKLPTFMGAVPFRRARQSMERSRRLGWDMKGLAILAFFLGLWSGIVEVVKQTPKQISEGLSGR